MRVLLYLCLFSAVAHAQIVNVQGALAKPPDKNEVGGQVALKLAWSEGNVPLVDVSGAASVVWKHDRFLTLAQARSEYARAIGLTTAKKTFEHLRERVSLSCVWRWELFVQHEYDQFRRLSLRALAGTGPALQILDEKNVALLAGATYMFEYEELDNRANTTDAGAAYQEHRASLYITGRERLVDNVALVQTFYAQPRLDEPSNYRLLGEAAVEVKLSSRIALTDGFVFDYDTRPPQGVKSWDTMLKVGLVINI